MSQTVEPPKRSPELDVIDALLGLAEATTAHTRLDTLLPAITELTCRVLNCWGCLLSLREEKAAPLVPAAECGFPSTVAQLFYDAAVTANGVPFLERVLGEESTALTKVDMARIPEALQRALSVHLSPQKGEGEPAIFGVPLLHLDRSLGGLVLIAEAEGIGPHERDLIAVIARQTALAIACIQASEAERRVHQDFDAVRQTIALLTAELDLETVYQRVAERAAVTFGAAGAALFLWENSQQLQPSIAPIATHGLSAQLARQRRLPVEMVEQWLKRSQVLEPFRNPESQPAIGRDSGQLAQQRLHAGLIIPLQRGERVLGLVEVYANASTLRLDDDGLALAQAFAHEASVALENAQLYAALHTERERLRALSTRLTQAQEAERTRIARELHDEAGQALTTVRLQLDYLVTALPDNVPLHYRRQLEETQTLVGRTLEEIRRISIDLRPSLLDDLGLAPALRWHCDRLSRHSDMQVRFVSKQGTRRVVPEIETAVYRATQEALTNIARHADAGAVEVTLDFQNSRLRLTIVDDGKGFSDSAGSRGGVGLIGMRERISAVGGTLNITSEPGKGSELSIEVSL